MQGLGGPDLQGHQSRIRGSHRRRSRSPAGPGGPEPARPLHHGDRCGSLTREGGICTCHSPDDYDRETACMADLEDGVGHWW